MEGCLDFFNEYVMGMLQIGVGFHYYTKFLNKKAGFAPCLLFVVYGAAVMTMQAGSLYSFFAYVLMLAAVGIFAYREEVLISILYAIVTGEIMQLCYGIFNAALSMVFPLLNSLPQKVLSITFMLLGNLAVFAIIFCYRMIYRYFVCSDADSGEKRSPYAVLILTPTLLIFLMSAYINYTVYGNTLITDENGKILNTDHRQALVIQFLGIMSLFCVMYAYRRLLENVRLSTQLSLLAQQEHYLNQYVEEARAHYESTKAFRHDIKNHITVTRELLQNGRWRQALDYVTDLEEGTGELSFPCSTGNPVVDILIGNKLGIARNSAIDVHCALTLPYPCAIRDIDFCIILSNALDNAISACQKMEGNQERFIRVTGNVQGDFILIEVANSHLGKGMFREGTGLSNIRRTAEKYQGAVHLKRENTAVVLNVLLIIPQRD
ncbi:MAG: GHKL domain-containing protein [Lachnospiraceae bacterium]|nr:GHKL domain-containing protein [Lachnospiraceae bacterium]